MTANEIRDSYKKFFESKGHTIVPSAPMVIKDDPTLMFTNAGMNQWKDIILGNKQPEPRRRTDSQKCLRVSGKHNDLEEVGHDTYHHTMFEMLGNWSFGDYFKEGAIDYAWEYLVDVLHLNPDDLYVTVFEGAPEEGLCRDSEAASYWAKHVPTSHIIDGNKHDNFWEMGDTGPCGPCSEIHLDSRTPEEKAKTLGRTLVNKDDPQVIEIWNIVFMQYNRKADGSLEPLPMHVIDTGMGFERLVRALQGKHSNYDTDIFQPIIKEICRLTGHEYGKDEATDVAMRVVADHLRAVAFSIADGQLPGNAKAGYVIRRILRRAVRYAYTFLGQKEAFMYKLLPVLIYEMGEAYPELSAQRELIGRVMKEEEDSFLRTLEKGISLLSNAIDELKSAGKTQLDGIQAFRLFDTYGFPLDLTQLICREHGITVDEAQFDEEMQKQKSRARNAAQVENSDWVEVHSGEQQFVGYDYTEHECHILRYRKVTQKKNTYFELVLDYTPFYGEMGGQVGDTGVLVSEDETVEVIDTKRENNQSIHIVSALPKNLEANFMACVDTEKRAASAANHTATHLLDYVLKQVLGEHVEQKGSYVSADTLRFDFSHFQKVTDDELRQVERMVNAMIRQDIPLDEHRDTPIEEAKQMGAISLFGEKYGKEVRVVTIGDYSVELCGGTHVGNTSEIGLFKIVKEEGIGSGTRRILAVTGKEAFEAYREQEDALKAVAATLKAPQLKEVPHKVEGLQEQLRQLQKENAELKEKAAAAAAGDVFKDVKEVNGHRYIASQVSVSDAGALRTFADNWKQKDYSDVLVLVAAIGDKVNVLVASKTKDLHAGNLVKELAPIVDGRGGGKPDMAMAGGSNQAKIQELLDSVAGKL